MNGTRTFFSGGSDGAMHALKIATGEPVWNWPVSKRGLNTAALMVGPDVIDLAQRREHGHERDGHAGRRARPASKGTLTDKDARWLVRGVQAGYASPVSDGQRIYVVDNGGILFALRREGPARRLWRTEPRHDSEVVAGARRRQAVCRHRERQVLHHPAAAPTGAEILDQDWLRQRRQSPEPIIASPAVARGRVYVVSMDAIYAIGPKMPPAGAAANPATGAPKPAAASLPAGVPAALLVTPTELILKPGEAVALTVERVRRERRGRSRCPARRRGRSRT